MRRSRASGSSQGGSTAGSASRTSSATSATSLIEEYGAGRFARAGSACTRRSTRSTSALPRTRSGARSPSRATRPPRSISISPRTGAIRAMAAVIPNRPKNEFNLVSQARRQPGSTFKTFVLAAAVELGINPDSTYYDSEPFTYSVHPVGNCEDGSWWCVHTYANDYYGWSSIRSATIRSDNTVYAQLTLDVTPEKVADVARRMGVRSHARRRRCVRAVDRPRVGCRSPARPRIRDTRRSRPGGVHAEPMAIRRVVLPDGARGQDSGLGCAQATASDLGGNRGHGHAHPRAEHAVRNRNARGVRPSRGRQDRDERGAQGRVVRGIYAGPCDDDVGRLHAAPRSRW